MSLRLKNWFSQVTATAVKAGTRYLDGDKPPSATFQDHLEHHDLSSLSLLKKSRLWFYTWSIKRKYAAIQFRLSKI